MVAHASIQDVCFLFHHSSPGKETGGWILDRSRTPSILCMDDGGFPVVPVLRCLSHSWAGKRLIRLILAATVHVNGVCLVQVELAFPSYPNPFVPLEPKEKSNRTHPSFLSKLTGFPSIHHQTHRTGTTSHPHLGPSSSSAGTVLSRLLPPIDFPSVSPSDRPSSNLSRSLLDVPSRHAEKIESKTEKKKKKDEKKKRTNRRRHETKDEGARAAHVLHVLRCEAEATWRRARGWKRSVWNE